MFGLTAADAVLSGADTPVATATTANTMDATRPKTNARRGRCPLLLSERHGHGTIAQPKSGRDTRRGGRRDQNGDGSVRHTDGPLLSILKGPADRSRQRT